MKHTYDIAGMHCGSCVAKIDTALRTVKGITDTQVMLNPPRAEVTMDHHIPTDTLQNAVAERSDYRLTEAKSSPAMSATASEESEDSTSISDDQPPESLYPLLLIVGYILGTVVLIELASETQSWMRGMRHFMAGFFLVFSFFKLLDPPGFVSAYRGYDLLARRSKAWAWSYPCVELLLGVAYLIDVFPVAVNAITLVLMLIGAAGVLKALRDKQAIRCACLGTALNLPMTKVTLVEDLTMAVMAAVMLVWLFT